MSAGGRAQIHRNCIFRRVKLYGDRHDQVYEPEGDRYLLPDVCLSRGVFLDGTSPAELPRAVEVVPTNGAALRHALAV